MTESNLKEKYGNKKLWVIKDKLISNAFEHDFSGIDTLIDDGEYSIPVRSFIRVKMEPMLRYKAEMDEKYRQIITYAVIKDKDNGNIFGTKRIGGDERLVGKISIGIGGHVEPPEGLYEALYREIEEEVGVKVNQIHLCPFNGYVYSSDEPVSRVHVGLVFTALVDKKYVKVLETDKLVGEWFSIEELTKAAVDGKLEGWSNIVLDKVLMA